MAMQPASRLTVGVALAALPISYLFVTGGGNYFGQGYHAMVAMHPWLFWLSRAAGLLSPLAAGSAVAWAVVALRTATGGTRTAVWILMWMAVLCGLFVTLDIPGV